MGRGIELRTVFTDTSRMVDHNRTLGGGLSNNITHETNTGPTPETMDGQNMVPTGWTRVEVDQGNDIKINITTTRGVTIVAITIITNITIIGITSIK